MIPAEIADAKAKWHKISGRTFGITENFAVNRECAVSLQTIPGLLAHIDEQAADLAQDEIVIRAKMECIDEMAKQIEQLKAALVTSGAPDTSFGNKRYYSNICPAR